MIDELVPSSGHARLAKQWANLAYREGFGSDRTVIDMLVGHIDELDGQLREARAACEPEGGYVFAIIFDDYDRRHELVLTEAAARERFRRISDSWNAHLFVKVESNTRDDPAAARNIPWPPRAACEGAGSIPSEIACDHSFIDIANEVIVHGNMCTKCGALKS